MTNTPVIAADTLITRSEDCAFSDLDGEVVMINIETNGYYGLDVIGSRIWELLETPTTLADLCHTLEQEFEVEPETCRRDVTVLIESLRDEQLVHIGPA